MPIIKQINTCYYKSIILLLSLEILCERDEQIHISHISFCFSLHVPNCLVQT